jgi:hypothetical protein
MTTRLLPIMPCYRRLLNATPANLAVSSPPLKGSSSMQCRPMIVTISPAAVGFFLDSATLLRLVARGVPLLARTRVLPCSTKIIWLVG